MTTKLLTVAGLAATLALGALAATPASAQDGHHWHPIRHLNRLHRAYARDVAMGHYRAAERAHLRARTIREHLRARRWHHWH